jgi:hypothetical protein
MHTVEEVAFGSNRYEKTVHLRDEVMRKPLGFRLKTTIYPLKNKLPYLQF